MKIFCFILFMGILNSCTLNMVNSHVEGQATDLVDTTPTQSADIPLNLDLPIT